MHYLNFCSHSRNYNHLHFEILFYAPQLWNMFTLRAKYTNNMSRHCRRRSGMLSLWGEKKWPWKDSLIIKNNVRQPNLFSRYVDFSHSAILFWVPAELVVVPLLRRKHNAIVHFTPSIPLQCIGSATSYSWIKFVHSQPSIATKCIPRLADATPCKWWSNTTGTKVWAKQVHGKLCWYFSLQSTRIATIAHA